MTEPADWPGRLLLSANTLCQKASELRAALLDTQRSRLLTDATDASQAAQEEVLKFTETLNQALAVLIDLAAFDSPDREFPDLTQGFSFECQNVVYGVNVFRIEETER